ncbi:glutathione S-transferase family protein [Qipengyuania sp. MTN3-11]|uniref:glutathione S-transferase family protein n=1 Tax=Qipengyuania sp. MTN3-11 TaxID=3056557 RepID=UPI0036F2CEAF
MTVIVHHLNNSRSQRILWLLEELGVDYELVAYQRDAQTNLAPPELKAVHPLGKSPVIEDAGRSISESGAIIEYLCVRYGGDRWVPRYGSDDWIAHAEWMQFAESSFFVPVMLKIYFGRLGEGAAPLFPRIEEQLAAHIEFAEERIGENLHFIGEDWTAVDVMMSFPAEIAVMQGYAEKAPKLAAFVEKIHARDAWQRARQKTGPYFAW